MSKELKEILVSECSVQFLQQFIKLIYQSSSFITLYKSTGSVKAGGCRQASAAEDELHCFIFFTFMLNDRKRLKGRGIAT